MKKFLTALLIGFSALTLFGCQSKPDTHALNTELNTAINNQQYAKAEGINTAINSVNATAASKKRATTLHAIVSAQSAFDAGNFTTAKNLIKGVTSNDQKLQKVADQLHTKASTLAKQSSTLTTQLKQARSLHDAGSDQAAATLLKKIINGKTIMQPELRSQYIKALKLLTELNITATSSSTEATASSDTSSSSSNSTASSASDNSSATPEGQPISGSDTITDAEITQARAEIKALGEDPTYFSNNDVRRAILNARADGRTHLKASDWQ